MRHVSTLIGLAACALTAPALAQNAADAIDRFTAAVQAGADFTVGEFASVVQQTDTAALARLAKCKPGQRLSRGDEVMVIWDCTKVRQGSWIGTGFVYRDGNIVSLSVGPMTRVSPE